MAWTQSVTRTRWLAVKLAVVGAGSVLAAGLLSLMVTWWYPMGWRHEPAGRETQPCS